MRQLILLSTLGCHLCELAKQEIEPLLLPLSLVIEEVDIANDEELLKKYGVRIPVIKLAGQSQELGWPFDIQQAAEFLQKQL